MQNCVAEFALCVRVHPHLKYEHFNSLNMLVADSLPEGCIAFAIVHFIVCFARVASQPTVMQVLVVVGAS